MEEVVIVTDTNGTFWEAHIPQRPDFSDVENVCASLRKLAENDGLPITSSNIQHIHRIVDHLDQMYYWAIEEGSTFREEPSFLLLCKAQELALLCMTTKRPKIVTAALRLTRHLLRHKQAGPLFFETAAKFTGENVFSDDDSSSGVFFFDLLARVMEEHGGVVELQSEATAVAIVAAEIDIESFLVGDVISHVLTALERHGGRHTIIQSEGVRLFASLVNLKRDVVCCSDRADAAVSTPTAVLFSHVGVVVRFVLHAANANADNIEVKYNAACFFRRCASYPENVAVLLQSGVFPFLIRALPFAAQVTELFFELMEAVAYFVPLLDHLQRRSLVLVVRRILLQTAQHFLITICAGLIVRLLSVQSNSDVTVCRELRVVEEEKHITSGGIMCSDMIALNDNDIRVFMIEQSIPQLLCHAADTLGEEDATLRRVLKKAIRSLSQFQWR